MPKLTIDRIEGWSGILTVNFEVFLLLNFKRQMFIKELLFV